LPPLEESGLTTMIIGLTGGIAAGKSTVRNLLAAQVSLKAFDADACVRQLLDGDAQVIRGIHDLFGADSLASDGKPDRARLRELIYADGSARRRLEQLLHPLVRSRWQALRADCLAANDHFLADIPLLFETGAETHFDTIIVVGCSPATQLARLAARGIRRPTAEAMLASQWPIGQKTERADFIIWNDGSLSALGRQIELLSKQLFSV
jgi:dephospho-CoA kinase